MPNLNRVLLMGNLTRDPELRYLPSNMPVVNIGVAVNRRWRNPQGEQQEETTFVDCESFGKQAELINQYLRKGRPIFIEGRLRLDQWQDKEGNQRSKLKIIVESFQFVDSKPGGAGGPGGPGGGDAMEEAGESHGGGGGGGYPQRAPSAPRSNTGVRSGAPSAGPARSAPTGPPPNDHQPINDDDIPF